MYLLFFAKSLFDPIFPQTGKLINYSWVDFSVIRLLVSFKK